ncbi:MAG: hypothetical protein AAF806_15190 [Bacteroidota bacterium]
MKFINLLTTPLLILFCTTLSFGQGFIFGIKGGPSIGIQNWGGFDRDPLIKYHGILYVESIAEDNSFSLFAQGGYHIRGSALRNQFAISIGSNDLFRLPTREFQFRNASVAVGVKQKYQMRGLLKSYYMVGVRGDYTINTNLQQYEAINLQFGTLFYPLDAFVQKWNVGALLGGGFEFPFSELIGSSIELTINPDFTFAYRQPQLNGVYNPFTGNNQTISERLIRNVTVELTFGMRFLRKVVYVD